MAVNGADTAWILVSAAMVMLMTPALAFFYGGMVRRKNLLSTMMMSVAIIAVIGVLWVLFGYSLAFGTDHGGVIGGLNFLGLSGVGQEPSTVYATTVPQYAFVMYQAMFAIITVALITGAVVERMKFSALLLFGVLWFAIVYLPVAHWVWGAGGWLAKLGVLDFAGGTVVHITAGVSAFSLARVLGPRNGYTQKDTMEPNNIPLVVLGAGILWFGWFGFNAGSALTSGGLASSAFLTTNTSAAAAAATWMTLSWIHKRPTILGTVTGAVAGLATITPAAGYVTPMAAMAIGVLAAITCYYGMALLKIKHGTDDSLDVFACHGLGGILGTLSVGIFASLAVNPAGANGLIYGNPMQLAKQLLGVVVIGAFAYIMTYIIGVAIRKTMGLRVSQMEESIGLDVSQHGERAYGGMLR
jgi:ammonium transporter, Amt family